MNRLILLKRNRECDRRILEKLADRRPSSWAMPTSRWLPFFWLLGLFSDSQRKLWLDQIGSSRSLDRPSPRRLQPLVTTEGVGAGDDVRG